uniref:Predicted RNA binding protein YcfA, dsRBD-like fold, HicA-like mRNA interferase family n=1 Tax=Candidatus Kentrum sp. SD TaxID=2126332 RepID=A0A450Z420_9GAMM|nr:MAG: Predicted RNA binding protein YcfA, dsRBD-like fold, HicA-like mRNA interferase family [Candidatus Kentron sp. SD]VFK48553.1 MAG: Predicted RNA binding protein YcfA, dsRBD-like fold, HicA-like mRNA interferase family [Candidatus Kentron sp. SD]VFK79661.1 MAG: Predicted RNA binding protein YcfA, dsRBD-like fold, HicA-like mRNA interferase family [Candidatus Kentron sp. SD]
MGRLRIFSGRQICQLLERHGFREVGRKGSHIVMQKQLSGGTITVPVPDHGELRTGTLMSITRRSGIPRSEFE